MVLALLAQEALAAGIASFNLLGILVGHRLPIRITQAAFSRGVSGITRIIGAPRFRQRTLAA